MFYVILSSVLLTFFMVSGFLGLWFIFRRSRALYCYVWRDYNPAFIYLVFALICLIAAYFVGTQIPDCYVL